MTSQPEPVSILIGMMIGLCTASILWLILWSEEEKKYRRFLIDKKLAQEYLEYERTRRTMIRQLRQ